MPIQPSQIAGLLEPYLGPPDARRLRRYIDVHRYTPTLNARVNLTAIRNEEEIVTRHFGESFFIARYLFSLCNPVFSVVKGVEVADLGSGTGFPGIPLKLWAPDISLTLIESNHKKANK